MILTFVFVNRNDVTVAVQIKKTCVNMNKGCGCVVVYRSEKRQVYCEYEDDIRCDRTVVSYTLPLFSLNGIMNKHWRLKQCNNLALSIRTSLSWIWEWILKKCNNSDGEDKLVINIKYWNNNRAQIYTTRYSQPQF